AEHRDQRARNPGDIVAEQADENHVRPRRRLRDREQLGEAAIADPLVHVDRLAMHLRHRGGCAAHRDDRAQREDRQEREIDVVLVAHRRFHQASATLTGISTTMTTRSGQRSTPAATNVARVTRCAGRRRSLMVARTICVAVAIKRPAAAAARLANMPRRAGSAPYCRYRMPATIISTIGGPINPSSAANAPGRPAQREPYMIEKLRMLPPGSTWHSASCSLNSSGVSQPRSCTMMRRDQASTPPKPQTAILAKARKSSPAPGMCRATASAGAAEDGAEASGWVMVQMDCVVRRAAAPKRDGCDSPGVGTV